MVRTGRGEACDGGKIGLRLQSQGGVRPLQHRLELRQVGGGLRAQVLAGRLQIRLDAGKQAFGGGLDLLGAVVDGGIREAVGDLLGLLG